jgi:16S rRNA (cytosine1402-N4)-methyltransferase
MVHKSVLVDEVIDALAPAREGTVVDATCGEGGHSAAILDRLRPARLIAFDADSALLAEARENLASKDGVSFIRSNFITMPEVLSREGLKGVDGILIDLGISMFHYRSSGRGFSFDAEEPLDMRIDTSLPLTAATVVNTYPEEKLKRLLWAFGEERFAALIARRVAEARSTKKFRSARDLANLVAAVIPKKFHTDIHPATRTFQALRIEVNAELTNLEYILGPAAGLLNPGGRLAVITFHSLEDRIVKHAFRALAEGEITDEARGTRAKAGYRVVTKKPVGPSEAEIRRNPSSRSALLRVLERA